MLQAAVFCQGGITARYEFGRGWFRLEQLCGKVIGMASQISSSNDDSSSSTQFDKQFWSEYRESLIAEVRALQRRIKAIERSMQNPRRVDTKQEKQ